MPDTYGHVTEETKGNFLLLEKKKVIMSFNFVTKPHIFTFGLTLNGSSSATRDRKGYCKSGHYLLKQGGA